MAGTSDLPPPPTYFEALSGQLNRGWAPLYGVVDGDTKFVDLPIPELYELDVDPSERINLATAEPERVTKFRELLAPLRALDPGAARQPEDEETLARLQSLGYLSASGTGKSDYTEEDDPKGLMDLDIALREVVRLYGDRDLEGALRQAREIVERRPGMRMALMELAQLERESGNLDAAVAALEEAYVLNPADSGVLALLGAYLTQAGKAAEALEITEPEGRLAEPDIDVLLVRSLAFARLQEIPAALETLENARRVDPGNPMVRVHTGTVYLMGGDRERAREAFEEALVSNPDTVAALTALGIMDVEDGRVETGVDHWRRAVTRDPQQFSRLLAFGTYVWEQGQTSAARPLLQLFVEQAPKDIYGAEISRLKGVLDSTG
jgi:tetratricopeptide (TPR) repeat protein